MVVPSLDRVTAALPRRSNREPMQTAETDVIGTIFFTRSFDDTVW